MGITGSDAAQHRLQYRSEKDACVCVCVKIQLDNMVSMLCGNILRVVLIRIAKNGRNTSYPCRLGSRHVLKCLG